MQAVPEIHEERNKYLQKFYLSARKSDDRGLQSLRAKIVIVGNSKWVKNHHFCAQLSHCFSIYPNNYSPQCWWLVVEIFTSPLRGLGKTPLATSTGVNNCYILVLITSDVMFKWLAYTSPDLLARFCNVNLSNKKFSLIFFLPSF